MNRYKIQPNYALLLLLVMAFLAMQWTTTHIHLAEQHSHDGGSHQHQVDAHDHSFSSGMVTAIDFSQQTNHDNIIEFDREDGLPKKGTQKAASTTTLVGTTVHLLAPFLLVSIQTPVVTNTKSSYVNRSTLNPRAPPQTS